MPVYEVRTRCRASFSFDYQTVPSRCLSCPIDLLRFLSGEHVIVSEEGKLPISASTPVIGRCSRPRPPVTTAMWVDPPRGLRGGSSTKSPIATRLGSRWSNKAGYSLRQTRPDSSSHHFSPDLFCLCNWACCRGVMLMWLPDTALILK